MKKFVGSILLVGVTSVGLGACSGGNGTPFCDKARELTKALGTKSDVSTEDAVKAVVAYKFMANNIPKDLKDVTKKDIDDLALVIQAQFIDNDIAAIADKVDTTRLTATSDKMRQYNEKHCDIKYTK